MVRSREEDDDELEFEEDDDYEDEDRRTGPKKKKRKKTNALLDLEAEEDDAEDDEEEEEITGLIAADHEDDAEVDREREQMRAQKFERERAMQDDDPQAMEAYFRDRFGDDNYADEDEEAGAPDTSGIDQQSLLPTIRDPRLFIVKCRKPGHERRAVFSLLQKSFNLRRKGIDIGIFSAIAPEHLRGRVYVEAISASQVEAAVNGLDLFVTYDSVKPLRLDEMTDVLKVGKRTDKQVEGNWVRMTRGTYKGDLAQVCGIREGANEGQLMIRLIPRLDLKGEKDYMEDLDGDDYEDDKDKNGPRRKGRPPQRLFDKKELYRLTGSADVYTQRDRQTGEVFEVWNDELYRYGLLYKRVSVKTLITGESVQPQVEELDKWLAAEVRMRQAFGDDPTSMEAAEAARGLGLDINSVAGRKGTKLFKGDSIRVVAGEQKGLRGTIVSIDGEVIHMRTPEFPTPLRVDRSDVRKTFNVGDNIKVSSGKRAGYAGVIVRVEDDFLTVFTDSTREEIRVLSSQVADSADVNTDIGAKKTGALQSRMQYELFDLVQMLSDSHEYGVVTQVRNDGVSLLTAQNTIRVVPVGAIKGKMRDTSVRAIDARGNPIAPNDTIHVVTGPQKDRQGIVKHVAEATVFFKARDELNNCGMVAAAASDCTAATAAARRLTSTLRQAAQPTFKMPAPIPKGSMASLGRGGLGGFRGGGGPPRRDELFRKDVKIKRGQYKGHMGKVVDATDTKVRVELKSKMKTITLSREMVKPLDEQVGTSRPNGSYASDRQGPRAPNAPSISGGYGNRTPGGLGSRTPRFDSGYGRTPRHGGFGSQTPKYGSATPRAGGMTPGHFGGMTPAREEFGRTPGRSDPFGGYGDYRTPLPTTPAGEGANPYGPFSAKTPATPAAVQTPLGAAYPAMEPRTPAGIADPNTPAYGMEPPTPAPGMEPTTPAPGMGLEPRTPAPGLEPRTPAPGVEPSTPMVQEPATPHTPGMPQTPRPPEEEAAELGYKVLIDVEVLVKSENNFPGVVTSASTDGSDIMVRMLGGDKQGQTIRVSEITPVQPRPDVGETQELIKVLDGAYVGRVGRLQNVVTLPDDTLEGHIKFTTGEEAKLQMSLVAKCNDGS